MRDPTHIKRAPRVATDLAATVVDGGGTEFAAIVTDISKQGFRLTCGETLQIGEFVHLRVPRYGDFPAQIRWALGNEAGGVFMEPVRLG